MSYIEVGPNQIFAGKTISHPYRPLPVVKHCPSSVFSDSCCFFSKGKMNMVRTTCGKNNLSPIWAPLCCQMYLLTPIVFPKGKCIYS